jgi:hypothetical protein
MPPSAIFQLLSKSRCSQVRVRATLKINPSTLAKLRGRKKTQVGDLWFATTYPGEGKLVAAVSAHLMQTREKNVYELTMVWFLTEGNPPPEFVDFTPVEPFLAGVFGEREVEVRAAFAFDNNQIVSFFQPINVGEQSQILDEIIGFTGIKRDREGKILYTMEIAITDTSIEQKLSFRQTVRIEDNMPIALLETASKLSALAIKPKEVS